MSPPAPAEGGSAFSNSAAQAPRSTNFDDGGDRDDNRRDSLNAFSAAAAAATLTPYTAARASFDTGGARRNGSSPRRNYTVDGLAEIDERESRSGAGDRATTSTTNDVENPASRPVAARLMEDVPPESRIVLEFRDLSCFVPRLFPAAGGGGGSGGAGAGGALMRSATVLGRSVTRRRRQQQPAGSGGNESVVAGSTSEAGGGGSIATPSSSSKPMRQVSIGREGQGERERGRRKKKEKLNPSLSTSGKTHTHTHSPFHRFSSISPGAASTARSSP